MQAKCMTTTWVSLLHFANFTLRFGVLYRMKFKSLLNVDKYLMCFSRWARVQLAGGMRIFTTTKSCCRSTKIVVACVPTLTFFKHRHKIRVRTYLASIQGWGSASSALFYSLRTLPSRWTASCIRRWILFLFLLLPWIMNDIKQEVDFNRFEFKTFSSDFHCYSDLKFII